MELLTERGLHQVFLEVVEDNRREGSPVVVDREGTVAELMPDQLSSEKFNSPATASPSSPPKSPNLNARRFP